MSAPFLFDTHEQAAAFAQSDGYFGGREACSALRHGALHAAEAQATALRPRGSPSWPSTLGAT